ncbi:MAG TPA: hypothetical protein VIH95_08005 [Acidimicrobiales bacterium]
MARRSVWLVTGLVAGAASSLYAERKLRRTVEAASARLQPDALAAEVGRSARQAVASTGDRLRDAVAQGREEKRRRELELWAELHPDGVGSVSPGASDDRYRSITGYDVPTDVAPDGADAPAPATHTATRRARRAARRSPSHLGK